MDDRIEQLDTFATFGDLLKYLRVRAQLTQKDLSIAVGYSEAQISRLESNKRAPDQDALRALFIPALGLADEPVTVARLMALAEAVNEPGQAQAVHDLASVVEKRHNSARRADFACRS